MTDPAATTSALTLATPALLAFLLGTALGHLKLARPFYRKIIPNIGTITRHIAQEALHDPAAAAARMRPTAHFVALVIAVRHLALLLGLATGAHLLWPTEAAGGLPARVDAFFAVYGCFSALTLFVIPRGIAASLPATRPEQARLKAQVQNDPLTTLVIPLSLAGAGMCL